MLLTLGLDSQFALMETVTTAILDGIPALRSYKIWVVLGVAVVGYGGGIIFTTNVSFKSNRCVTRFFKRDCRNLNGLSFRAQEEESSFLLFIYSLFFFTMFFVSVAIE